MLEQLGMCYIRYFIDDVSISSIAFLAQEPMHSIGMQSYVQANATHFTQTGLNCCWFDLSMYVNASRINILEEQPHKHSLPFKHVLTNVHYDDWWRRYASMNLITTGFGNGLEKPMIMITYCLVGP